MVNTYISFWTWVRASTTYIHILIHTSQSNRTKIQALVEFREGFQSRLSPLCSQRLCRRGRWCSVEFPELCASNLCLGRDFPENTIEVNLRKMSSISYFDIQVSEVFQFAQRLQQFNLESRLLSLQSLISKEWRIIMMKRLRVYLFYQVVFYAKYSEIWAALERLQKLKD